VTAIAVSLSIILYLLNFVNPYFSEMTPFGEISVDNTFVCRYNG